VHKVLAAIGAAGKPSVVAMNKIDLITAEDHDVLNRRFPDAVFCSAAEGLGLDALLERLGTELSRLKVEVELEFPFQRGDLVARVHERGEVLDESYSERGTRMVARIGRDTLAEVSSYVATAGD
jgi:GTP-binding protein HflX